MHNQLQWNKGTYQEGRLEFTTPDPQYTHSHFQTHTNTHTQLLSVSSTHTLTVSQTRIKDRV